MRNRMALPAAALAALVGGGSVQAHHSGFAYEQTPIWVQGTVVRFEHINPHTIITLEDRSKAGEIRRWAVEGPPQGALDRRGGSDVAKIGDRLEVCAFPYKPVAELSRLWPGVDFSARRLGRAADGSTPQFVAGHVLVLPEGEKRFWEPHGVLGECIRSSAYPRQSWLVFLNSSPGARQAWCEQRAYAHVQSTPPLKALVEAINSSLAEPCP